MARLGTASPTRAVRNSPARAASTRGLPLAKKCTVAVWLAWRAAEALARAERSSAFRVWDGVAVSAPTRVDRARRAAAPVMVVLPMFAATPWDTSTLELTESPCTTPWAALRALRKSTLDSPGSKASTFTVPFCMGMMRRAAAYPAVGLFRVVGALTLPRAA